MLQNQDLRAQREEIGVALIAEREGPPKPCYDETG